MRRGRYMVQLAKIGDFCSSPVMDTPLTDATDTVAAQLAYLAEADFSQLDDADLVAAHGLLSSRAINEPPVQACKKPPEKVEPIPSAAARVRLTRDQAQRNLSQGIGDLVSDAVSSELDSVVSEAVSSELDRVLFEGLRELTRSIADLPNKMLGNERIVIPAPVVNVHVPAPPAPIVNVQVPPQPAPQVTVQLPDLPAPVAPVVNVTVPQQPAPDVHVNVSAPAPPPIERTVVRDAEGFIEKIVEKPVRR